MNIAFERLKRKHPHKVYGCKLPEVVSEFATHGVPLPRNSSYGGEFLDSSLFRAVKGCGVAVNRLRCTDIVVGGPDGCDFRVSYRAKDSRFCAFDMARPLRQPTQHAAAPIVSQATT